MKKHYLYYSIIFAATFLLNIINNNVSAQTYGNEWIKPGNTYYKFKVGRNAICRITQAQLNNIGFGNVPGSQFAILREGQEVPIYVTTNGVLGANDYIEFYGEIANGIIDTDLYLNPDFQPNIKKNLISDTAYYFITHDNSNHLRITQVDNVIPVTPPTPAPYFWATVASNRNFTYLGLGQSHNFSEYYYSSEYEKAEGWSTKTIGSATEDYLFYTKPVYTADPNLQPKLSFIISNHSRILNTTSAKIILNQNTEIFDTAFNRFEMIKKELVIPFSHFNGFNPNQTRVDITTNTNFLNHGIYLTFPRTFQFSDNVMTQLAEMRLPANQRYLEINGFNNGSVADPARLIDRTQGKIYKGVIQNGQLKFYLDNSTVERDLVLASPSNILNINAFEPIVFRNYDLTFNQGNYLIITHNKFINASPSYVTDYLNYRKSTSGGSYNAQLIDVTELYNQFAYGFEYHPKSIKNFLRYAMDKWGVKPEYLFIIGKGIQYQIYNNYKINAANYTFAPVPTWGHPGSDNLFSTFNNDNKPALATGRLSAWNNNEIGVYLEKVKDYEAAIKISSIPNTTNDLWKKRALHIAGATSQDLQVSLLASLNICKNIIEDTLTGATVATIFKKDTDPVSSVADARIDSLINEGVSYISFYGHASASGFDYNLNVPYQYNAKPKLPVFYAYGCDVAQIFLLPNANPALQVKTISEDYLIAPNGGSIAMIAGNNIGWTSILPTYMQNIYREAAFRSYGKTLGMQYKNNIHHLQNINNSKMMDIHTQSILLQGDPGLSRYNPDLPDFAIELQSISTNPPNISTTIDSFEISVPVFNLGKSIKDSVMVRLTQTRPGNNTILYQDSIYIKISLTDTIKFKVPVDPNQDPGLNIFTLKIDADDRFSEISEQNNQVNLELYIFSENLMPIYPKEYAIVYQQGVTLKASTMNAFAPIRRYKMEIDTTINFNSPIKQSTEITSLGGVVQWKPNITLQDSVVYYWRTAIDSLLNDSIVWNYSSFVYLKDGSEGWNQSHYFQYLNDKYNGVNLMPTRQFQFAPYTNNFQSFNKIVPETSRIFDVSDKLNDIEINAWSCVAGNTIQIGIIDSMTGKPIKRPSGCNRVSTNYEFNLTTAAGRNNARLLLESIEDGQYIHIKNITLNGYWNGAKEQLKPKNWMNDTLVYGSNNSLYHALKNVGFNDIDLVDTMQSYIFFRRKGRTDVPVQQVVSSGVEAIFLQAEFNSFPDTGLVSGTVIGPAIEWKELKWRQSALDNQSQNDSSFVEVYGISNNNTETLLYSGFAKDTSLSFIAASTYPNIRLKWNSVDNINRTSAQLDYWRVLYDPVPEAALNAAKHLTFKDTIYEGENAVLQLAIENLTPKAMDSMLVKYQIIDANNVVHNLSNVRYRPLPGNDTIIAEFQFDPSVYKGRNLLFVDANPNNDQIEQYHPNNIGYLAFNVVPDNHNPLLDVTFDGVHILDKDLVSAKPFIKIVLNDESKFSALSDTSLMQVQLAYPDNLQNPINIPFDGINCKFIAAHLEEGKNEAVIEFRPELKDDGIYKLIVKGKDNAGNLAGNAPTYEIHFTVENKSSITNVLNYPNPFSTSTAFVFTLTGSEIPSQFKIQILSVTGKVVREITKAELGNIHIGRNITEYKWDGKDQYGQMLGNGVYLYRVVTSIRGEEVEHRKNSNVDKYFKNGYGKLYIMR